MLLEKVCTKCDFLLPVEQFNKKVTAKDGRQSYCKACSKECNAATALEDKP